VQKPALAVWPEYAVDIYIQEPSAARDELFTASRDLGIDFVLGGPFSAFGSTKLRYRNAVFAVRAGKLAGRYDKLHLVPFAERIPAWWPLRAHRQEYEPGPRPFVLATRDARVGAFVCAESLDPAIPRALATAGADLLANLSNDYWFSDDAAALEQLNAAAWRAVENRRWLLRATPTGSAVIDPHGRVREMTSRGNAEFLVADVWPRAPVTPYQRAGDLAAWLAVAGVGLASLRRLLY